MKKILWLAILLLPLTATAEDSINCTFVGANMHCTLVLDDTFNAISVLEGEQAVQNDRIDALEANAGGDAPKQLVVVDANGGFIGSVVEFEDSPDWRVFISFGDGPNDFTQRRAHSDGVSIARVYYAELNCAGAAYYAYQTSIGVLGIGSDGSVLRVTDAPLWNTSMQSQSIRTGQCVNSSSSSEFRATEIVGSIPVTLPLRLEQR